ncbi:MAG: multiheme c-type cytochrome [Pirellulaceae bacterium]
MKNLRTPALWYIVLASVALVAASSTTARRSPWETTLRAEEKQNESEDEPPAGKLPPLTIDSDSPLLLEEGTEHSKRDTPVVPSVAENSACYVCHDNFQQEQLVTQHVDGDVGCVDCHGKSYDHRNDENNITPPDVMFPRHKIDASCVDCHETHDVPAAEIVARLRERLPRLAQSQDLACTDCHGFHRLAHRTVIWDRATGELLTGKQNASAPNAPAPNATPTLDALKSLAGSWVRVGENGQPTEQVVSTFRVTAAGSAVMEVLFPGTDHEMVTIYHQDGDDLLLTRYCASGNQPRMKCRGGSDPQHLIFEFELVDATDMRSLHDAHVHAGTIAIVGPDHLRSQWQRFDQGKPSEVLTFDLMRLIE